jgi:pSer/pThr/pTyr-binding forkhead associated (FHA) protein
MDARLKILFGPLSGQTIPVLVGELILGRHEDCLLGPLSDFVSRRHCALTHDGDTLLIRDLGSKNGTLVNGTRVGTTNSLLVHGDIVSVGDLLVQIELVPSTGKVPAATPPALMGTGVFDGDTIQARDSNGNSPQIAPPESAPVASDISATPPNPVQPA